MKNKRKRKPKESVRGKAWEMLSTFIENIGRCRGNLRIGQRLVSPTGRQNAPSAHIAFDRMANERCLTLDTPKCPGLPVADLRSARNPFVVTFGADF